MNPVDSIRKIFTVFKDSGATIRPHFFLTGSSGSGKSYVTDAICESLDLPFLVINAASLTKEGISGSSLSRVLAPLLNVGSKPVVVFVDEFDKLFMRGVEAAHDSTAGVQDEFLKTVEDCATIAGDYGKFHTLDTSNILFVFAGAFGGKEITNTDGLAEFGIRTEFLGRVALVYHLPIVSLERMLLILKESPLLESYLKLTGSNKEDALTCLEHQLTNKYSMNIIGIRLVNQLIHQYFIDGLPKPTVKKSKIL